MARAGLSRRRGMRLARRGDGCGDILVGLEAIELLERGDDVAHIEEAVALEPEINESRLHAGEDFRYPALVDVANHAARALAFDENLGDLIFLENRHPCFVGARGDDHLLGHARNSAQPERSPRFCRRAYPSGARAEACAPPETPPRSRKARRSTLGPQFVKRRMRTLRIRPNPASVAIIDDPP